LASAGLFAVEPFCIETFGRLGPGAIRLLHSARQRLLVSDDSQAIRSWAGVALYQRWLALISCELQRSMHDAALAMWGAIGRLTATIPEEAPLVAAALPFAGRSW